MRSMLLVAAALVLFAIPSQALTVVQITSDVNSNQTWGPTGTVVGDVFWIRNSINVVAGVQLTIQPNVVVKFDPYQGITVNGKLRALGTLAQPIVVTSIRDDNNLGGDTNGDGNLTTPSPSDWAGITFSAVSPNFQSLLQYCDVRYAGYYARGAVVFQSSSDSLANCYLRRSYYGVDCQGTAAPVVVGTSIEASTMTPIVLDFNSLPVFASLVFSSSDNGYDALGLRGGSFSGSNTLIQRGAVVGSNQVPNVTYVLFNSLTINQGASLTVAPGVVIKPLNYTSITIDGNLTMNGTPADTITVTSVNDDNFGQPRDTNNNGSQTSPHPGDWGQIIFDQGSTGSLQYCRLKFGGAYSPDGALVSMTNNSIGLSHCLLSDAGSGLALHGISAPVIDTVMVNNSSSVPVEMSASANPTLNGLVFTSNAITALGIFGEDVATNAHLYKRNVAGYTNFTYCVLGSLHMLSPAILTVDPGVVVKFNQYYGNLVIDGGLVANGSAENGEIVFTSFRDDQYGNPPDTNGDGSLTNPAAYDWGGIHFTATSNDVVDVINRCRVTYGGYYYAPVSGNLWITSAAPTITNSILSVGDNGILIDGNSAPIIRGCTISHCNRAPFALSVLSAPVITDNNFSNNGYNGIGLLSESISQNATLRCMQHVGSPPYAYVSYGTLTVGAGYVLTVSDSVVVKSPYGYGNVMTIAGSLLAKGHPGAARIVFTSINDDNYGGDTNANGNNTQPHAGDWGQIDFTSTSDSTSVLRNCLLQFGGYSDHGAVYTESCPTRIKQCEFFSNVTAMTFTGTSQAVVDSCNVLNCTGLPIVFSLVSNPTFGPNIVLSNNAYTILGILGETVAQNVRTRKRNLGTIENIAYAPSRDLSIAFGARWTIDPGIVIKLGRGGCNGYYDPIGNNITVSGALQAAATPDSMIVFTSTADDAHGGDTYGDGATTAPAPGDWGSLIFTNVSDDAHTVLNYCRFLYGGGCYYYGAGGAITFQDAGPAVGNCLFTRNVTAVTLEGASAPNFNTCWMDSSYFAPVKMSLASNPTFNNVQFAGNGYTALSVIPETIASDVFWKIRAVSGRHNMPYMLESGTLAAGLGATLTLQPGLIVKLGSGARIDVQRGIIAEGKAMPESLIVFTSQHDDFYGGESDPGFEQAPAPGDWQGIDIEGTAIDAQCRFRDCVVRYGSPYYYGYGTGYGAIRAINSSPSIDSCLVAYNNIGISAEGASNPTVHGSSIYGNTNYGLANFGTGFCVQADHNWWGDKSGPSDTTSVVDLCGLTTNLGLGDMVTNNVNYLPFDTTGIMTALLGDVSLNGSVTAFDASDVLQFLVPQITLGPLQQVVADVDLSGGITEADASLILQYVAGGIVTLPGEQLSLDKQKSLWAGLRAGMRLAQAGDLQVSLDPAYQAGSDWVLPVRVQGSTPLYGLGLRLSGDGAKSMTGVTVTSSSALSAQGVVGGTARIAMASAAPVAPGVVALIRFTPKAGGDWKAPILEWTRINGRELPLGNGPAVPGASYLSRPAPNPSFGSATLQLGLAQREAGSRLTVHVFDVAGRNLRLLLDRPAAPGVMPLTWNLKDDRGRRVPVGIYWIRAEAGRFTATQRMVVAR